MKKHSQSSGEEGVQTDGSGILVYKIVAIEDGACTSMSVAGKCSATYSQEQVTLPPIAGSPLFVYRTLEVAQAEFLRIKQLNAQLPWTAHIPLELWKARTSGEVWLPARIPKAGAWYSSLLRHARGDGLYGCYAFFWQNVSYCLKHCIGKRAGVKIDAAVTIGCTDLILLERVAFPAGEEGSACL